MSGGGTRKLLAQFPGEDADLELLEMQLSTTKRPWSGQFGSRLRGPNCVTTTAAPFYTHPRRRQRQRSQMTVWSDRHLLDEVQREQTRRVLSRIRNWNFNAFTLDRLLDGRNLSTLCAHLFQTNGLMRHFRLDAVTVWRFFAMVEGGYHSANPYHNNVHAADVTQAMSCFLAEPRMQKHLEPVDVLGALIAAVCHDVDHPGLNEKFLVATSSHLAGLYSGSSVLENHHWRSTISIMWESGLARLLSDRDRADVEEIVKNLILATDISKQQEFLRTLRQYQETNELDLSQRKYRHFILQIAVKCADISNPCRRWNISRLWSHRACEEFFRQGDLERELGMPVTPLCDRNNVTVAKVQSGFYRFIASPLFEEWHKFMASPLSATMLNTLNANQARWDVICSRESLPVMADSIVSQASTSSSSGGGSVQGDSRGEGQDNPRQHRLSRSSAEGDEDSDPCTSYPYTPLESPEGSNLLRQNSGGIASIRTFSRRHSIPTGDSLSLLLAPLTTKSGADADLDRQRLEARRRSLFFCDSEFVVTPSSVKLIAATRRRIFAAAAAANKQLVSTAPASCEGEGHRNEADDGPEGVEGRKNEEEEQIATNHHVTFHLTRTSESSDNSKDGFDLDIDQCNQNVALMHQNMNNKTAYGEFAGGGAGCGGRRRGSAPCNLLLNQINAAKNATSAAVAVAASVSAAASREVSPISCRSSSGSRPSCVVRRGSLPADLLSSESSCRGSLRPAVAHAKCNAKARKVRRRKSMDKANSLDAGASLLPRPRRGSLRSSSCGGINHRNTNNHLQLPKQSAERRHCRRGSEPVYLPGSPKLRAAGIDGIEILLSRESNLRNRAGGGKRSPNLDVQAAAAAAAASRVQVLRNGQLHPPPKPPSSQVQSEVVGQVKRCLPSTNGTRSSSSRRGSLPTGLI